MARMHKSNMTFTTTMEHFTLQRTKKMILHVKAADGAGWDGRKKDIVSIVPVDLDVSLYTEWGHEV